MVTNIVITGSSGVLGRAIYNKLIDNTFLKIYGLVYSRTENPNKIKCDLTDSNNLESTFNSLKPVIVIHCAAERRPDVVSRDVNRATAINVASTSFIKEWCANNNCILIFISTDYVFDGSNPPYNEQSEPNPLNLYGSMKLEGEKVVLSNERNIVLRLPVLYGFVEKLDESAVTVLFTKVKDTSRQVPMSDFERRFPTHCDDVAETIGRIVQYIIKSPGQLSGVLQYQSEEEMTKLEMARTMARLYHIPFDHIHAEPIQIEQPNRGGTKRPYKSQMTCDRLKQAGLYHPARLFAEGIEAVLKPYAVNPT